VEDKGDIGEEVLEGEVVKSISITMSTYTSRASFSSSTIISVCIFRFVSAFKVPESSSEQEEIF